MLRDFLVIVLLLVLGVGCRYEHGDEAIAPDATAPMRCGIDDVARQLAGDDAVDCGTFEWDELQDPGHACVVAALEAGKPFLLIQHEQGIDSDSATALVGTRSGALEALSFDSWRKYTSDAAGIVNAHECKHWSVVASEGEWLDSARTQTIVSPGQRMIVCGQWTEGVRICE